MNQNRAFRELHLIQFKNVLTGILPMFTMGAREHHHAPVADGGTWESWVPHFLERHCKSEKTLDRYHDSWKWVALWLQHSRLYSPRQITYKLAIRYVDWRNGLQKAHRKDGLPQHRYHGTEVPRHADE